MQKTLIITLEYPPQIGGIASAVYNLAAHLPPAETVVWAPSLPGDKNFDAKNAWKTYRGQPYYPLFWPRWLKLYWQIKKIVQQEQIERIFVHHALPVGYVAMMIKSANKIPYTIFFHGTDLEVGARFKKGKLENICRSAEKIVVNSKFLSDKLAANLRQLGANKVQIIHPCPADFFFQARPEEELRKIKSELALTGKKVILTVARLDEGKGFPHLAHLMPQILAKVPNAVWMIIGDGPKRQAFLKQIEKDNLPSAIRYLGNVAYADLPKYYQVADIFALLTHKDESREEGWGTVYLEAAASGLPVVAGRAGGVEEAVENLKTGVIVDVYQSAGVVSAITQLLLQPDYASQMGANGRARVEAEYTWAKQIAKLI